MKQVGVYTDSNLICIECAVNGSVEGEVALLDGLPDGFTCDQCGAVINYKGEGNE